MPERMGFCLLKKFFLQGISPALFTKDKSSGNPLSLFQGVY